MSQRNFIRNAGVFAMQKLLRKDINKERGRKKKAPLSGCLLDAAEVERLKKLSRYVKKATPGGHFLATSSRTF